MDQDALEHASGRTAHVGAKLRGAREAAGLSIADIAARTRITIRHLESIEGGRLGELPGITYALGFVRSYARSLGMDEASVVEQARHELGHSGPRIATQPDYTPADPRRVPPRLLVWTAAVLLGLLVGGYFLFRASVTPDPAAPAPEDFAAVDAADDAAAPVGGATGGPTATPPLFGAAGAAAPAAAPATGEVVLTARAPVWLRIYDNGRNRLFEKEMAAGERYVVPANADRPMILTGKPDALAVTVGGQPVPPLGTGERTIADVGISAAALAARTATPAPGSSLPPVAN